MVNLDAWIYIDCSRCPRRLRDFRRSATRLGVGLTEMSFNRCPRRLRGMDGPGVGVPGLERARGGRVGGARPFGAGSGSRPDQRSQALAAHSWPPRHERARGHRVGRAEPGEVQGTTSPRSLVPHLLPGLYSREPRSEPPHGGEHNLHALGVRGLCAKHQGREVPVLSGRLEEVGPEDQGGVRRRRRGRGDGAPVPGRDWHAPAPPAPMPARGGQPGEHGSGGHGWF